MSKNSRLGSSGSVVKMRQHVIKLEDEVMKREAIAEGVHKRAPP